MIGAAGVVGHMSAEHYLLVWRFGEELNDRHQRQWVGEQGDKGVAPVDCEAED